MARDGKNRLPIAMDDTPRGVLMSRKEALALMAGAMALPVSTARAEGGAKPATPICVARPEMTAGPFYVDTELERSDIRLALSDGAPTPGALLELYFNVFQLRGQACTPLAGAVVDVWHCDAAGRYSGVSDRRGNTEDQKFLRGYQLTDEAGRAHFTTIYPGWYPGRTVHIHFTVRSAEGAETPFTFTSQLFFDDTLTDAVHGKEPYTAAGPRDRRNADDGIYRRGGDQLMLAAKEEEGVYGAVFDVAIAMEA